MKLIKLTLYCILLLYAAALNTQERPPISIFTPKDYGAETQNWSISQSKDKYIYVANNKGLLEYNGANWQVYTSPNETIIRSVSVIDDLIFTGCNNEFGYWKKNEYGLLSYTSLSKKLEIEFLDDEEFWNIISIDDYILFQSLDRIYIYNKTNEVYNIIESESIIYKIFKVGDSIYFQKTKEGVFKIENGTAKLVSNHPVLINNRLVNIFSIDGNLLINTENNGFYILKNNELSKWDIQANISLSEVSVFRSIQLKDGSFILGTRSNGVIHLTPNGEIDYNMDIVHGLSNNTVHGVFEDDENNIWLALESGINCINIDSPFSIYLDEAGKIGTVHASAVFNDHLYLGTNQGLFYKQINSKEEFKQIVEIQESVWCLVEIGNTLFCGHDTGTSVINNDKADKIKGFQQGTWNIKPLEGREDLLLQGNYNGLYILKNNNGKWVLRNKIEGYGLSSKFFEIYNNSVFVSHEYKGVFKIEVDKDFTKATKVEKIPTTGKEYNSSLIKYKDDLLYTYNEGVFKYNSPDNKFIKDTLLSEFFTKNEYTSGRLVHTPPTNALWGFSKNNLNYLAPGKLSNTPRVNKVAFSNSLPMGLAGYENISYISDQKYIIGTSNGFIVLDLDKAEKKLYDVSINRITNWNLNSESNVIDKKTDGYFKHEENNIEFTFSVAEFDKYLDTEYQFVLEGLHTNWSGWSSNPRAIFENLPHGDYVFKVRAKVGNIVTKNVDSFSFNIKRPWYLSNTAIAGYV
ncbi:MAG: LuxR family transcriptional regulator, partial [Flaviramulus sp.]